MYGSPSVIVYTHRRGDFGEEDLASTLVPKERHILCNAILFLGKRGFDVNI